MGSRLTVLQKGLILIAVPLVFQIAFIAVLIGAQRQQSEAARLAHETSVVIIQFYRVLTPLIEAQNALRGFVLIGQPRLDQAFREASDRCTTELERLKALVAGDAENEQRVQRIRAHASDLLVWLGGTAELTRMGQQQAALTRIAQRTFEPVANELDDFLGTALQEETARRRAVEDAERRVLATVIAGMLIALGLMAALAVVFSRDIAARLSVVADNAKRMASGLPLHPPLPGNDEIRRVDEAFRNMGEALRAAAEAQRTHRVQLERNALELAAVNRELRDRNEENELFVYSVSHDLRSPLVNLQGFSRELRHACDELARVVDEPGVPPSARERMRRLLDADMAEAIHFISTAVSRLGTIIDALLRLSRVGRVEYHPTAVDVRAVAAKVVESMHATIAERGITVVIGSLPPCWGDQAAMEQVFANLLDNAIKYLDPARPGRVEIGSGAHDAAGASPPLPGLVTYFVKDSGIGIGNAEQAKIFLPFQRAHAVGEGEGIGLAIVRRIVERHGGRVWVESTAGAGATFFVALPAHPSAMPGRRIDGHGASEAVA